MANPLDSVDTLTFDIFGTVLDLTGSLVPPIRAFLDGRDTDVDADALWAAWRARQRVEQYQDALLMVGHSGYQESCRRAFVYCLRDAGVPYSDAEVAEFMRCYQDLAPFDDAVRGLHRLRDSGRYRLVALSNGEPDFLEHLADQPHKVRLRRHNLRPGGRRLQATPGRVPRGGAHPGVRA